MSQLAILKAMRERGGTVTTHDLAGVTSYPAHCLQTLARQGYVSRIAKGAYALTPLGQASSSQPKGVIQ